MTTTLNPFHAIEYAKMGYKQMDVFLRDNQLVPSVYSMPSWAALRISDQLQDARQTSASSVVFFDTKAEMHDTPAHDRIPFSLVYPYSYDEILETVLWWPR